MLPHSLECVKEAFSNKELMFVTFVLHSIESDLLHNIFEKLCISCKSSAFWHLAILNE